MTFTHFQLERLSARRRCDAEQCQKSCQRRRPTWKGLTFSDNSWYIRCHLNYKTRSLAGLVQTSLRRVLAKFLHTVNNIPFCFSFQFFIANCSHHLLPQFLYLSLVLSSHSFKHVILLFLESERQDRSVWTSATRQRSLLELWASSARSFVPSPPNKWKLKQKRDILQLYKLKSEPIFFCWNHKASADTKPAVDKTKSNCC